MCAEGIELGQGGQEIQRMIFGYWCPDPSSGARGFPRGGAAAWRATPFDFRVFGDADVLPLLDHWGSDFASLFRAIRLPACKADIARLVLLFRGGGLYVDAHCAPGSPAALAELMRQLPEYELTLFDELAHDPDYAGTGILNSIMGARPGTRILEGIIANARDNLRVQRHREAEGGGHNYSIYKLTGPWIIWHRLFERVGKGGRLRAELSPTVFIRRYDRDGGSAPVLTYVHNEYRDQERHWSRRQKREPLFRSSPRVDPSGP
jgi:GNAT superfamily N-acetyltransferase